MSTMSTWGENSMGLTSDVRRDGMIANDRIQISTVAAIRLATIVTLATAVVT